MDDGRWMDGWKMAFVSCFACILLFEIPLFLYMINTPLMAHQIIIMPCHGSFSLTTFRPIEVLNRTYHPAIQYPKTQPS
jgi:hypothetical protein